MAEPTEPQEPVEPSTAEPTSPVSAAEHVGVEPVVPEVDEEEVVDDVAQPVTVEPVVVEPVTAEPIAAEPVAAQPYTAEPVVAAPDAAAAAAAREVVYVQAPTPPPLRHNRGFGVLISLLGAVAFALLFIGVVAVIVAIAGASVDETLAQFLRSMAFWVPVAVYAVISVLFALIVNRAAWWAHVLGSLFVAGLSYAISAGIILLALGVIGMTPDEGVQQAAEVFGSPWLITALVIAREVSLWFGLAIASRGRRVKERNAADRAAFEQSVADRRAEYERAHPSL
jgi:hypothetical protein